MTESIPEISLQEFLDEIGIARRRIPIDGTLETTFRCNLSCVHCYVNEPARSAPVRARELSLARLQRLVDEIAEAGCLNLLLTGGEVLCRPDFPELYLHALRRGLRVTVFTNGTMITDRIADLLADYRPARVEITLYGMSRETYERVTRTPGSYDKCLAGIRRLLERGIPLKLKTMVLTWNEHELEDMRAFARSLGVGFRHDGHLNARVDCGANRNPELQVPPERLAAIDLATPAGRASIEESLHGCADPSRAPQESQPLYSCGAGQISFTVDPYGRMTLCQLSRRNAFDLRDDSFERGWNEFFPVLRARTWQTHSVCRSCSLIGICGSCPGAAELEHGDPEAVISTFCEIAHHKAHAVLGDAGGHRRDASCCLGTGKPSATATAASAAAGGCGSCRAGMPQAETLVRLGVRRTTAPSPRPVA
jgi:radical SAM protein with 4Fe4S-binding SPASM domain